MSHDGHASRATGIGRNVAPTDTRTGYTEKRRVIEDLWSREFSHLGPAPGVDYGEYLAHSKLRLLRDLDSVRRTRRKVRGRGCHPLFVCISEQSVELKLVRFDAVWETTCAQHLLGIGADETGSPVVGEVLSAQLL